MATVTILQLPQAVGLTGAEQIEGVQNNTSVRIPLNAIAAQVPGVPGPPGPIGPSGTGAVFSQSISAVPGTTNANYAPTLYVPGFTTRLRLIAAAGGSTFSGIVASPTDGWSMLICNDSTIDYLFFAHQNSGSASANQFLCPTSVTNALAPLACTTIVYVGNNWRFAS